MGHNVTVTIPVTWIPVDLTTSATKQSLLSSPEFRRMVTKGLLTLVTEAHALEVLESADAQAENARIYNMTQQLDPNSPTTPAEVTNLKTAESGEISGFAMNLANADNMEESRVLNTIRSNESTLTVADMKYIAENSKHAKVKAYLADKLLQAA